MRSLLALCFVFLSAVQVWAVTPSVTLYIDGAVVEQEITGGRNPAEILLPAAARTESLRVVPSAGTVVDRVDVVPAIKGGKREDEIMRLIERQEQLKDRLRALETREEIFRAAAKSQSGKAPRRTKGNPEPLSTIRQGTDFALSQLEEVYRIRRKTDKELKDLQARVDAGRGTQGEGERIARIWLTGKGGRATVSYVRKDVTMSPHYDFRLDGSGKADISVRAEVQGSTKSPAAGAVMGKLGEATDKYPVIRASYRNHYLDLPAHGERFTTGPSSTLSFSITNSSSHDIPPGNFSCFWRGAYLGTASFAGLRAGETREISCGGK